ncbi:MAG: hypothetical protein HZB38_00510, partial [Planctomycetes bacterium]|nr:hypothetical protein [Planctomycetota bacterium]
MLAVRPHAAPAQTADEDQLLLPDSISNNDIEMRGRFVRRWRQNDGTHVLVYTGGFRLNSGKREFTSDNAVIWINQRLSEPERRKFYDLTVYLSENAVVREPGGTTTEDSVLLVSNVRTYGKVFSLQDAHSPEAAEDNELYQLALKDRARIEGEEPEPAAPGMDIAVRSPTEVERKRVKPRRVSISVRGGMEPATTPSGEPVQVLTGGIYATQSGGPDAPFLQIQADNAVVFLREKAAASFVGELDGSSSQPAPPPSYEKQADGGGLLGGGARLGDLATAVYLEGD